MAIPWLTVLKAVPWSTVIDNAPLVADRARQLWGQATKKPAPAAAQSTAVDAESSPLSAQLQALRVQTADLDRRLASASELINALAEQNTQLVARIEANRRQVRRLTAVVIVLAALLLAWVLKG